MSESTQTSRADLCDLKRYTCVVFPKSRKKRLDKHAWSSLFPTPPPPPLNCSFPPEKCWIFGYRRCAKPRASRQKTVGWGERTLGLFVKSFLPAFREKQHRNICSHHTGRLAKLSRVGQTNATLCNMVARRTQHVAGNNVARCRTNMLHPFGQGLI